MNQYRDELEMAGHVTWPLNNDYLQTYLFESDRWWKEDGGFEQMEEGCYIHVCAVISPNGTLELIDSQEDGGGLWIPTIHFKNVDHLMRIFELLWKAFSHETTLATGTKIVKGLLT